MFYKVKCPSCQKEYSSNQLFTANNLPVTVVCECRTQFDASVGKVLGKFSPNVKERKRAK